jgi:acetyl esterase/lipase
VGTNEIMLDDAVRFTELAREAGVCATLRVWEGMVHGSHEGVGGIRPQTYCRRPA